MSKKLIVLDAGHGGRDVGAVNERTGLRESEMALDVVLRAKRLAEATGHFDVILTRSDDTFLTLSERPQIANDANADAFISYHFNSATNPDVESSWEVYTTKRQNNSDELATCVGIQHQTLFPNQAARVDFSDGDLDKEANYAVIKRTNCVSILFEGEFIHTAEGAALIADPANREKMAKALVCGLCDHYRCPTPDFETTLTLEERVARIEAKLNL